MKSIEQIYRECMVQEKIYNKQYSSKDVKSFSTAIKSAASMAGKLSNIVSTMNIELGSDVLMSDFGLTPRSAEKLIDLLDELADSAADSMRFYMTPEYKNGLIIGKSGAEPI